MENKWMKIVRDLVSLAVGTFGLVYSQVTGQTSVELVVVYAALLGVPGVLNLMEIKGRSVESKALESQQESKATIDSLNGQSSPSQPPGSHRQSE